MKIVLTDLDGTLLDHDTYSFEDAQDALEQLREQAIPLIIVSSKTRREIEFWRQRLQNTHPFVVENGGAVYLPGGYFASPPPESTHQDSYNLVQFGAPYSDLVACLKRASFESQCEVLGFHDMTPEEIAIRCDMPLEQARLAQQREFDEPFEILNPARTDHLLAAIKEEGRNWTQGGRFYHILGDNDKARAVEVLTQLYRNSYSDLLTVGLGDGLNDLPFLKQVDVAVIVRSDQSERLRTELPGAYLTKSPGSKGWNQAILRILAGAAVG
jgi:mannosyl-3-phosphoglycerate phosphatase family protein